MYDWFLSPKELQIGPSVFSYELANRIIQPKEWIHSADMDAVMYLFRENTYLRRWKPDCVAFMNCLFGVQINSAYQKLVGNKKGYKLDPWLLHYRTCELPSHGRTRKVWDVDVHRVYAPVHVNGNHWISLCINFVQRTIEVFDCFGKKNNMHVEAFTVIIPRIVKEVQSPKNMKHLNITPYSVIYVPMQPHLNKSKCACGVYALKFIECHMLELNMSLLDSENIREARHKIAFDLLQAANDLVLIDRMLKYEPTPSAESEVIELD